MYGIAMTERKMFFEDTRAFVAEMSKQLPDRDVSFTFSSYSPDHFSVSINISAKRTEVQC